MQACRALRCLLNRLRKRAKRVRASILPRVQMCSRTEMVNLTCASWAFGNSRRRKTHNSALWRRVRQCACSLLCSQVAFVVSSLLFAREPLGTQPRSNCENPLYSRRLCAALSRALSKACYYIRYAFFRHCHLLLFASFTAYLARRKHFCTSKAALQRYAQFWKDSFYDYRSPKSFLVRCGRGHH